MPKHAKENLKPECSVTSKEILDGDGNFISFDDYGIQSEILKDEVSTVTFRNLIYENAHLFKDKVIMDVGSQLGILSLFAAKVGAKKIFAVGSSAMAIQSQIIKDNGFGDVVEVLQSEPEDITELPGGYEQVDVIVSLWMGYCLFHKSMLGRIITARDKWLAPDGLIFPDRAELFICGIDDVGFKENKINWWNDVQGFDMKALSGSAIREPSIDVFESRQVVTDKCLIKEVDLYDMKVEELTWSSEFTLRAERTDLVHALATFFTVEFTKCHKKMRLSTDPDSNFTHWKQTIFYLHDALTVKRDEELNAIFTMTPSEDNTSNMDVNIKIKFEGRFLKHQEHNAYTLY